MYRYAPAHAPFLLVDLESSAQISNSLSATTKPARLPAPGPTCVSVPFAFKRYSTFVLNEVAAFRLSFDMPVTYKKSTHFQLANGRLPG